MFLGLIDDGSVVIDKDVIDSVAKCLQRAVAAAKQLLPKKLAAFGAVEECDDDSGNED